MDASEKMVKQIMLSLSNIVPDALMAQIEIEIFKAVKNYSIDFAKNELMNINTESSLQTLAVFLMSKKVEGLSERTIQYYKAEIGKFIIQTNKPLEHITTNDVRLFIAKKSCSNTTKDNTLRILRSFFGWCTAEEYITRNPTLRIKKIKSEQKIKRPFTELEVEKLRNGAKDVREKAMIDILLSTGCRIGEIYQLDRTDIEGDTMVVRGKGNKERYVYLNAKTQVSIGDYLSTRTDDNPALFVSEQKPHNRLKISGMESRLRELGRELGIKNVHPHRFRRTAATTALNRGMPIEQVQQMLGHSQIQTTLIYAQSAQENMKASHKKFVT